MQYALIFHPTEKPSLTPPLSPILALTALTASLVQTKHSVLPQGHRKPGNILTLVTGLVCVFSASLAQLPLAGGYAPRSVQSDDANKTVWYWSLLKHVVRVNSFTGKFFGHDINSHENIETTEVYEQSIEHMWSTVAQ